MTNPPTFLGIFLGALCIIALLAALILLLMLWCWCAEWLDRRRMATALRRDVLRLSCPRGTRRVSGRGILRWRRF